jgi:signal transduction histidine kinase/ActR/RegA family two-component response regulator
MAVPIPAVSSLSPTVSFSSARLAELLSALEHVAAGDSELQLPISPLHDELDAIAYGINVLVGELRWAGARVLQAQEARADELRQALAAAQQANESRSVFLRNVNHEIRTPIAAILGFADLLASEDLPPEDRADFVAGLRSNGEAVLALLGDVLELARLDADKLVLAPEQVSVLELVREVQASLGVETRRKGLTLRLEVSGDAFAPIRTDRLRLRQILVNLIGNAVKFTEGGEIVVSLGAAASAAGELRIIDVTDEGIGIPPDRQPHLFEPFSQADPSIPHEYGGTGLGLALSRRLAAQLGGTLQLLHSAPGRGSAFRLTLAPLRASRGDLAEPDVTGAHSGEDVRGVRVLLAEDHPDIQRAMGRLLESAGASVELARDGREALALARASRYDVVLMDLRMPHLTGIEAARALREDGSGVAIIALTADPSPVRRKEALDAGCDACICKPFTIEELLSAIQATRRGSPTDADLPARATSPAGARSGTVSSSAWDGDSQPAPGVGEHIR